MKRKITLLTIILFILILTITITYGRFTLNKNITGSINVYSYNFCREKNINKLSDCMLVMENYSEDVDTAKQYIENKGEVNLSANAPTINFVESLKEITNQTNGIVYVSAHLTMSKSYVFDSSTGLYTLNNYVNDVPKDDYIDYYTCGNTTGTWNVCSRIFQIKEFREETTNISTAYRITKAVQHSFKEVSSFDSEVGLYALEDEYGTSYYYRGDVKNNYVSFGGYIWRIIRRNGDGTIRLIYSGTSTSSTGINATIGDYNYNSKYRDPTYIGYKYHEDFSFHDSSAIVYWTNYSENTSYYFGSSYTYDEETKKFKLSGNLTNAVWKNDYNNIINNYPYSCLSTSEKTECDVLIRAKRYVSTSTIGVNLLSYSSNNYNNTLLNTTESDIKKLLDTWYVNNFINKTNSSGIKYSDYIADSGFCNDRSLSSGNGYEISSHTKYGSFDRLMTKKIASLKCPQNTDIFKVSNGNLTYPIALITSDEVHLAGAYYNFVNTKYYLNINKAYWTMTPSQYTNYAALAYIWFVNTTGGMNNHYTSLTNGVRPVINLKNTVEIISGTGTSDDPYIITK